MDFSLRFASVEMTFVLSARRKRPDFSKESPRATSKAVERAIFHEVLAMRSIAKSEEMFKKAQTLLVGGGQGHKRPGKVHGRYPIYASRGAGVKFWDVDGNEYIDYLCAYGPMLLGYGHPKIDQAVKAQIDRGMIFNIHHPSELELAEKLCEVIPSCEMVSYFTGGSGATTGAVKIARAFTGRDKILRCGYHGWHDWTDARERGVPEAVRALSIVVPYNNIEALREALEANKNEVAIFMLEAFQGGGPGENYLADVKELCAKHGVVLCFDEVKTGFRFGFGGYQEYCGVTPDMSTFGKALGNGYDVAFTVGKREIMESVPDVWISATFHGQLLGIAAALAALEEMKAIDGYSLIWKRGQKLMDGLTQIVQRHGMPARMVGLPPMPRLAFEKGCDEIRDDFFAGTADRGVYFDPGHCWFISPAHTDEIIDQTLAAAEESAAALGKA